MKKSTYLIIYFFSRDRRELIKQKRRRNVLVQSVNDYTKGMVMTIFSLITSATSSQAIIQRQATTDSTQTVSARHRIRSSTSTLKSTSPSFSCVDENISQKSDHAVLGTLRNDHYPLLHNYNISLPSKTITRVKASTHHVADAALLKTAMFFVGPKLIFLALN